MAPLPGRRRPVSLPAPAVFLLPKVTPAVRKGFRVTLRADRSVVHVAAASYVRQGDDYVFKRENGTTARRIPVSTVRSVEIEA